jgi:thiol-disulfide isomerase/thioredoxin
MKAHWIVLAAMLAVGLGGPFAALAEETPAMHDGSTAPIALPMEGTVPSIHNATEWLNSPPLTASGLRGKVVLVEFWTYSCINWRRTLPYVRAWAAKYASRGLVVIGVHTPEFPFEKNIDNVRRAARELNIDFPIAIDNDYKVWNSFENEYWPALYFVDAQGRIRHHQFGEGDYARSETVLQQLLREAGASGVDRTLVSGDARGAEVAADWADLQSPETYAGYQSTANFSSPGGVVTDVRRTYAAPASLDLNHWALSGDWTMGKRAALLDLPGGGIAFRFHARDFNMVMGSATQEKPVRFRVLVDGLPPGASHGTDVDERGYGKVTEPRMYQLIRQSKPISDRRFHIEFLDSGVDVYDFTFG